MRELPSNILRMLYMLFNINIFTKVGMIILISIFSKLLSTDILLVAGSAFIIFGVISGIIMGLLDKTEKKKPAAPTV